MTLSSQKSQQAAEDFGFDSPISCIEEYITDSLCPCICMNPDCDYTEELEQDCQDGYCPECSTQTLRSIMILEGII